jgi:hypothetical protein
MILDTPLPIVEKDLLQWKTTTRSMPKKPYPVDFTNPDWRETEARGGLPFRLANRTETPALLDRT